jgi:hypothetical protein
VIARRCNRVFGCECGRCLAIWGRDRKRVISSALRGDLRLVTLTAPGGRLLSPYLFSMIRQSSPPSSWSWSMWRPGGMSRSMLPSISPLAGSLCVSLWCPRLKPSLLRVVPSDRSTLQSGLRL